MKEFLDSIIELKKNVRAYEIEDEYFVVVLDKSEEEFRSYDQENRKKFLERLEDRGFTAEEKELIHFAYDLGKESHRTQIRLTGERYFEHVRRSALILLDECGVNDANMVIAALLHDAVEDATTFGNSKEPRDHWISRVFFRLSRIFNPEVARMVIALTKPEMDGVIVKNKEEALNAYLVGLKKAPPKTILVKMADRLDNLRTSLKLSPEKKKKIIDESLEKLFPLFKSIMKLYPLQSARLMSEMEKAIDILRKSLPA